MPFLPASRTKRNLLKVASLGLAGLLAGLLAGCLDAPEVSANNFAPISSDTLSTDLAAQDAGLPKSIEATQIPALRHPPSARHLELGSVRPTAQPQISNLGGGY